MVIQLRLKKFRQYEDQTIKFKPHFSLIKGRNNAGKTTIFYGISYCLFGFIRGIKKLEQIAQFGEREFGAECVFTLKNRVYKIQRMHKLGKKSARCCFTLSEITADGEKIVLSSDYGDNLEVLNNKIIEILGFTRRYFEFAIFFRQGELLSILDGDKNIDLILGINAFIELNRGLNERIRELQKELVKLPLIEEEIKNINLEKQQNDEDISSDTSNIDWYERQLKKEKKNIQKFANLEIDKLNEEIFNLYINCLSRKNQIYKFQGKIEQIDNMYKSIFDDLEDDLNLNQKRDLINDELNLKNEDLIKLQKRIETLQEEKGDYNGIINRRKKVINKTNCEYCGAEISKEKFEYEMKKYEEEFKNIQIKLKDLKNKKNLLNQEINKMKKNLQNISFQINKFNSDRNRKKKILEEKEELIINLNKHQKNLKENIRDLYNKFKHLYNNLRDANFFYSSRVEKIISRFDKILSDPMEIGTINEYVQKNYSETSDLIKSCSSEILYYERCIKDYNNSLIRLKKRKERIEKRLENLRIQRQIIKKQHEKISFYKELVSHNKEILKLIREKSIIRLNYLIKNYYELLSDQHEFEGIRINPEDYSLEVKIEGYKDFIPASIYQGGGQKLILSLAFKLALGSVLQQPTFILADEPTYGADIKNRKNILEKLKTFPHFFQLLLITHQNPELFSENEVISIKKYREKSIVE